MSEPQVKIFGFFLVTTVILLLLATIVLVFVVLYQRKLISYIRSEEKLKLRLIDSENKALRLQINPHFLFNTLNSINACILTAERKVASRNLIKFAKLMRMVLNNTSRQTVSLSEELETIKLYMDLENLRRADAGFEYEIIVDPSLSSTDDINVPPLIFQPFVENAIIHGLSHKNSDRKLSIKVMADAEKQIRICIEDNGVGREASAQYRKHGAYEDQKGTGMQVSADRLCLLHKTMDVTRFLKVTDLFAAGDQPAGTRVEIAVPVEED